MTIGDIIKNKVHELGGNGLVNLDSSCGCGDKHNWFPCDCQNTEECKPAKWIYCKSCENNGQCTLQEEYDLGKIDADGCYVLIEQQEKMPNEQKCSFCDDSLTTDDNDSNLCGACADNLKAERERLMAEVAELEKEKYFYAARMLDKYSEYACPPDTCGKDRVSSGYCDGENSDCTRCWREFLMKGDLS